MRAVRSGTSWTISNIVGQLEYSTDSWSRHGHSRHSNFCKDHRDKIEVPDPLDVDDLISDKLNNRRKLARDRNIFSNISGGTAFLLQGVTENDSSFKPYKFKQMVRV